MNDFSITSKIPNLSLFNNNESKVNSNNSADFLQVAAESFKNLQTAQTVLVSENVNGGSVNFWKNKVEVENNSHTFEDSVKDKIDELLSRITSLLEEQKEK